MAAGFLAMSGAAAARRWRRYAGIVAVALLAPAAQAKGILSPGGGAAPVTAAMTAGIVNAQAAAAINAQSQTALARAVLAVQAMQKMQSAAHALVLQAPSQVPNGLVAGGLVPDAGLASPGVAKPVTDWTGARTPTQRSVAGTTSVTVSQTAASAILSWSSFNVGKATTVTFDQRGNSNWVALNRIAASGSPSQILGAIKASGKVFLLNPNGIIFGGSSQVNVGALLASSAAISDAQFTTNGIYSSVSGQSYNPSFTKAGGPILVQAGAEIGTNAPPSVTDGGGYVLLMGSTVDNQGTITTPDGQAELAAGDDFLIRPGASTTANQYSTTRGNEIAVQLKKPGGSRKGGAGLVSNGGLITASTGDITLAGETVAQDGLAFASTTVATRGTIHLLSDASDRFSNVTLAGDSLTMILPDAASGTALNGQRAALVAQSAIENGLRLRNVAGAFSDLSMLNDQEEQSRVEIVTGGDVAFQGGARVVAPAGQVAVSARGRIEVEAGALLDVAGLTDVALPMASNDLAVNIQNFEQRDAPQNRLADNLRNATVYVDQRALSAVPASSGDPATRDYTGGGLLEVSGYLNTTQHTIGEWSAVAGSITLSTGKSKGAVVVQSGAILDINGGSLAYQPGLLKQSYLLGTDGRLYNVNTAPAYVTYAGVYDGFVQDHASWQTAQTYGGVLNDPATIYQPGYLQGRAAGALDIIAPTTVFNGTIEDAVARGPFQTAAIPAGVTDPYTLGQNVVTPSGTLFLGVIGSTLQPGIGAIDFGAGSAARAGGLTLAQPIPKALRDTSDFDASALSAAELGALTVLTEGAITVSQPLRLAPGGVAQLYGAAVTINAALAAPAGAVTVANEYGGNALLAQGAKFTRRDKIVVGHAGVIDTAGTWTNAALDPSAPAATAFINGGPVSITTLTSLSIKAGALIDASAGALITPGREIGGAGGALTLGFAQGLSAFATPSPYQPGTFDLAGTLQSYGFTAGGALALTGGHFSIGPARKPVAGTVALDPAFFHSGFSSYTLNGQTVVAPATAVDVYQPVYQFTAASALAPSGGIPAAGTALAAGPALYLNLDPLLYLANPQLTSVTRRAGASLSITSKTFNLPATSSITVDPLQTIFLEAAGQTTINGDLTAPGGTIDVFNDASDPQFAKHGRLASIWIGGTSRIDASATAFVATDAAGGEIGVAPAGGSIVIGNTDSLNGGAGPGLAATVPVIVRAGAVLEASGSAAADRVIPSSGLGLLRDTTVAQGGTVALAGAGGTIALASSYGVYLDGQVSADAGGAGAAGGNFFLAIGTDLFVNNNGIADAPRNLTISQADTAKPLPKGLKPGQDSAALTLGTARISVARINRGGFGSATLYAFDGLIFDGNVDLALPQAISLNAGAFTETHDHDSVTIAAPYVLLNGQVQVQATHTSNPNGSGLPNVNDIGGYSTRPAKGSFTVDAGLIDLQDAIAFGGIEKRARGATGTVQIDLAGFKSETLNSTGDLRFAAAPPGVVTTSAIGTTLITTGNLSLQAAAIFAAGGAAEVEAGYDPKTKTTPARSKRVLSISRPDGAAALAPLALGGSVTLIAPNIMDGGVIWQPLGQITFDAANKIDFLPGSVTSVSASGLTIPYGGTTDGIHYAVNGLDVSAEASTRGYQPGGVLNGVTTGAITINGNKLNVSKGALLDLGGGGNLAGEGFISGEGGSTDVLYNPLLRASTGGGVTQPTLAAAPVYAIIAGPQQEVAPAQTFTPAGTAGSTPALGEQIVIPAGVPGLPAGRYTLLPAGYALNPGGYRVEFDGAASPAGMPVLALPNGSFAVAGETAIVNTAVIGGAPLNFTVTPAARVRSYAQYDTESYSQFLVASTALTGAPRPMLPADAGTLKLGFDGLPGDEITNFGATDLQGAAGGNGGTLQVGGGLLGFGVKVNLVFYGATRPARQRAYTVDLSAAAIDAFNPFFLQIGEAGSDFNTTVSGATLQPGASLRAARVVFTTVTGGVTMKSGSEIDTRGLGSVALGSTQLGNYSGGGSTVLDVGNGYFTYNVASVVGFTQYGAITVDAGAKIFTDGSIAFYNGGAVNISADAIYGGKYLDLAVPEINIGNPAALGATAPPGLTLTPAVLQRLAAGVPADNVPAVQILILAASGSLNFFGTTTLDLSGGNVQLVIDSPAIYGYGGSRDVATIAAGTIVWNGTINATGNVPVAALPGGVVANGPGTGAGTLDFDANDIVLGYSALDVPLRDTPLSRLTLGFGTVNLSAAGEITGNNQGTLAVYRSQAGYDQPGSGGALNLNTPLLTAANEARIGFTAGGALAVNGLGAAAAGAPAGAGAEIDLTGGSVAVNSAVALPSGKLDLHASGAIDFGAGAAIDLQGATGTVLGVTTHGTGGALIAESAAGNIAQAAGGVIDVSAVDNGAGSIAFTALGGGAGQVTLAGRLLGGGDVAAGDLDGSFSLAAQGLGGSLTAGFAALNNRLDGGGFYESRRFAFAQGDLAVGDGVTAHTVAIATNGGSLTVTGVIDATGPYAGNIDLAAQGDLVLATGAVLDAANTVTHLDQYGKEIAAVDAPVVSLTSANGVARLAAGATLDLGSLDGIAQGDLELNVPRVSNDSAGAGDAGIAAASGVLVEGAASIAVNAFATYHGLADPTGNVDSAKGVPDALITQAYLDGINSADTLPYMNAAAGNGDLARGLAGLAGGANRAVLHFRPGVRIVSATGNGDLTVQGDIDLAGYRYGLGANAAITGSGEPGVLAIRAGGNLYINGSITDGFGAPPDDTGTGVAHGWVLYAGNEPFGHDIVVPAAVTLARGTLIGNGQGDGAETVNYALPLGAGTILQDSVAPVKLTLAQAVTVPVTFIATSDIRSGGGRLLYGAGSVVAANKVLPAGATIGQGGSLPFTFDVGPVLWPANTAITDTGSLDKALNLLPGALIPGDSTIVLPKGAASVRTRAADAGGAASQGQIYPLGQLLPAGTLSWSIDLVAGADTTAAGMLAVQAPSGLAGAGDITLADTHYSQNSLNHSTPLYSVIRTGTGALNLAAGGSIAEASDYGIYTAGSSVFAAGAEAGSPFNLAQGRIGADNTLLGPNNKALAALDAGYQANYASGGGNVSISAAGNLAGYISVTFSNNNNNFSLTDTDAIGSWLWQQGGAGQAGAWWVEYGSFTIQPGTAGSPPPTVQLVGFQGIGTLGGGNLNVDVGGDAYGLNLVVASTGRAVAPGTLAQTGGGNINVAIGGALNGVLEPLALSNEDDGGGVISDLRGATRVAAGSIGLIVPTGGVLPGDTRTLGPLALENATISRGLQLAPGDGDVTVAARGDLVIQSMPDPGTVENFVNTTPVSFTPPRGAPINLKGGGNSQFSLWSSTTSVALGSAGGDISPGTNINSLTTNGTSNSQNGISNFAPPIVTIIAQNGNVEAQGVMELAPSVAGQIEILAGGSIYGGTFAVSGANPAFIDSVFNPEIDVTNYRSGNSVYLNASPQSPIVVYGGPSLLAFGADQPVGPVHPLNQAPAMVFANLDIVGAAFGGIDTQGGSGDAPTIDLGAEPFTIEAGRDIVASGSPASPDYFLNLTPADVTTIIAGRDILQSSADIAGPGTMLVEAGRNIYQADQGNLVSLGPAYDISTTNRDGGAGITVIAGTGTALVNGVPVATGPDYAGFAALYLNPDSTLGLQDARQIIAGNEAALYAYLVADYGYAGTPAGAYAAFLALPRPAQAVFLWRVFFAALNQSGLEYNQPAPATRAGSYALGKAAIATLFPAATASGAKISYAGDITMFGGSGIQTDFGGAIDSFTPGGQTIVGVEGATPPASAGLITSGSGDINVYTLGSLLLGESRILTTFGGSVLVWSAAGDINAGKGSKTSIDFAPAQIVYDRFGNVALSPTVPSTGAGIGTLNPIAEVAPGNVNLVAPLGTVDAGEAGVRSSGNVNIAAARVLNAANISASGSKTGVPTAPAVNVSALTSAGNAAGAAVQAAAQAGKSRDQTPPPSIWIVEVLGYGGGAAAPPPPPRKHRNGNGKTIAAFDTMGDAARRG